MTGKQIERVADNAYAVPSYSLQTITPNFDLYGTVQALGVVGEDDQLAGDEPKTTNPVITS